MALVPRRERERNHYVDLTRGAPSHSRWSPRLQLPSQSSLKAEPHLTIHSEVPRLARHYILYQSQRTELGIDGLARTNLRISEQGAE